MDWDAYVALAFDEVRLAGTESPQVTRRIMAAVDDLLEIAPAERRAALEAQRDLLSDEVRGSGRAQRDIEFALAPDSQGIGVDARLDGAQRSGGSARPTDADQRSHRERT
jgi:hypothetical protein